MDARAATTWPPTKTALPPNRVAVRGSCNVAPLSPGRCHSSGPRGAGRVAAWAARSELAPFVNVAWTRRRHDPRRGDHQSEAEYGSVESNDAAIVRLRSDPCGFHPPGVHRNAWLTGPASHRPNPAPRPRNHRHRQSTLRGAPARQQPEFHDGVVEPHSPSMCGGRAPRGTAWWMNEFVR